MYARLFKMTLGPGMRDVATGIADKAKPTYASLDGFVSVTFLIMDEVAGEYGSISVWQTKANADAAGEKLAQVTGPMFADKLKGAPEVETYEVYEPR